MVPTSTARNSNGWTPLHIAAQHKSSDEIELLIQHGADVNSQENSNGSTPLHIAAQHKSSDEIELLIQHGADVNSQRKLMAGLPCTLPLGTSHQTR